MAIAPSLAGKSPKSAGPLRAEGRHLKVIHPGVTLLLIILVAYAAAGLTWKLVGLTQERGAAVTSPSPLAVPTATEPPAPGPTATTLAGLHLFGRPERQVSAPPASPAESIAHPQTTLNILLRGVFVSSSPQQSLAIIAEKGKKGSEAIYGIGDQLPGDAELSEIRTDRVVLLRAGRYETLPLEAPITPAAAGDKAGPAAGRSEASQSGGNRSSVVIDRRRWESQLADLPGLANEVGVEPFPAEGKQLGYRLLAKSDGKLLNDLGLMPGDILIEVNGLALKDPSTALQAYAKIKEAEAITLRLIRDGRPETKEFTLGRTAE